MGSRLPGSQIFRLVGGEAYLILVPTVLIVLIA